jgi:hypothetical protein
MKHLAVCSFILVSTSALLQAQLTVPGLGVARYADHSVHVVRGVGGNLIVDPHKFAGAEAVSFGDSVGLVYSSGSIRLLQVANAAVIGEYPTDDPSPILHIDSAATSAIAWLPSKHLLVHWDGAHFTETSIDDVSLGGTVAFVSLASASSAQFFVSRTDSSVARVTVALPSGAVTSSDTIPAAQQWAFVQQGWTVSRDERGLVAERLDGNRQSVPLGNQPIPGGDLIVEQMSNHWIHLSSRSTGDDWALYVDPKKLDIFRLPPPAPEATR